MRKLKTWELNRKSIEQFKLSDKIPLVVILDNVRSLNNIGSVFRTCDAFLVEALYLCGITACPPNKEINKTALGSTESVNWKYFENTLEALNKLKEKGYVVISAEQAEESIKLNGFYPDKNLKYAIVLGHEVKGVQQEVVNFSDFCLEIPQQGTKHSLNVAVSAGILIWDFYLKLGK